MLTCVTFFSFLFILSNLSNLSILSIFCLQVGTSADRQLIFIDRNRDLYIMSLAKRTPAKLAAMADSAAWHDTTDMLAGTVDQKLVGG